LGSAPSKRIGACWGRLKRRAKAPTAQGVAKEVPTLAQTVGSLGLRTGRGPRLATPGAMRRTSGPRLVWAARKWVGSAPCVWVCWAV
jgi:hypothetical protein